MYNISQRSKKAYFINQTKFFIWDKVPMIHKFVFEIVDYTLCNIVQVDQLFEGKVFVFRDDFCQVLSVLPSRSHADAVSTSLYRSSL